MWLLAAPADTGGSSPEILIAVFTLLGVVVTVAGSVIVALINSRTGRTTPSPPPPDPTGGASADVRGLQRAMEGLVDDIVFLRERTAVHGQQILDLAATTKVVDVRLDRIEAAKDQDHPGWRLRSSEETA